MIIEVTESDIEHGQREVCRDCPVALALSRALGKPVHVFPRCAYYDNGEEWINLPQEVTAFIVRFDGRLPVSPFSFEVDV